MVLFFRLTRRKRLKKCSLRFCRRHYSTLRGFRSQKAKRRASCCCSCCVGKYVCCEREKEVFFCVFFSVFLCVCSCLLLLLIFSSVFAIMKN